MKIIKSLAIYRLTTLCDCSKFQQNMFLKNFASVSFRHFMTIGKLFLVHIREKTLYGYAKVFSLFLFLFIYLFILIQMFTNSIFFLEYVFSVYKLMFYAFLLQLVLNLVFSNSVPLSILVAFILVRYTCLALLTCTSKMSNT